MVRSDYFAEDNMANMGSQQQQQDMACDMYNVHQQ